LAVLLVAGCLSSPKPDAAGPAPAPSPPFLVHYLNGTLGDGAQVPLATSSLIRFYSTATGDLPLRDGAARFEARLDSEDVGVAFVRDGDGHLLCVVRTGRVCAGPVPGDAAGPWSLAVSSLTPRGGAYSLRVEEYADPPVPAGDGLPAAGPGVAVARSDLDGGEPTLAWLPDGRILAAAGSGVARLELDGSFTDATPPVDAAARQTLDPFLYGDPATGRVYVSQLASCMRLSWTDDGGATWLTNPATCGGPEQHHQKIAVGPGVGPGPRVVHIATMNLASWLATGTTEPPATGQQTTIFHSRSVDGGLTWSQNPAFVQEAEGMRARAVGNIAAMDDGTIAIVAYLCDRFVDADFNGVAVGRSTDLGLTWTWTKVAPGGGRCEGIDPGIAAAGDKLYVAWEDLTEGTGHVWWSVSGDGGATWSERQALPTGDLGSFVFTDAAASADRLAVAFLATADTPIGPTQAPGWALWRPYLASLDLKSGDWSVVRLQEDPVQVGPICMDGPMCLDGARNLLDFIDVQLSTDGRAAVAYPDGCEGACALPWQSRDAFLRIASEV
jgi:hypothetical protein